MGVDAAAGGRISYRKPRGQDTVLIRGRDMLAGGRTRKQRKTSSQRRPAMLDAQGRPDQIPDPVLCRRKSSAEYE